MQNSSFSEHLIVSTNYFIKYYIHLKNNHFLVAPNFSPRKIVMNKHLKKTTCVFFTIFTFGIEEMVKKMQKIHE